MHQHNQHRELSPSSDTIEIADRSPTCSPEAVEIDLDDDPTDDETQSPLRSLGPEERLYHQFPTMHRNFGYREGVEQICQSLSRSTLIVQSEFLLQLSDWLQLWLALSHDSPARCKVAFLGHNRDFWQTLSLVFAKLLSKKFILNGNGSRLRPRDLKTLEDLFVSWLEVCGQMFHCDSLEIHTARDADAPSAPDLISFRATAFMRHLFNLDAVLWQVLREHRVDVERICSLIMTRVASQSHLYITPLRELAKDCLPHLHIWQDTMSKYLTCTLQSLISVGQHFSLVQWSSVPHGEDIAGQLARDYVELIKHLETGLVQNSNRSSLSPGIYQSFLAALLELHKQIRELDDSVTEGLFRVRFVDLIDTDDSWMNNEMMSITNQIAEHDILWHFIQKGRMELRVWATKFLSDNLTYLHDLRQNQTRRNSKHDHFLRVVAKHLEDIQFLEYIVGVDSHPQLVSRSSNIVAFLAVCGYWHEYMVELICKAVASSQDGRMKTAIIDMSSLQLAQCMTVDEKLFFCQSLADLPYEKIDGETVACISGLVRSVLEAYATNSNPLPPIPFEICRRILRRSFSEEADSHPDPVCVVHETISLAQKVMDLYQEQDDRLKLYEQCIEDMQDATNRSSTGSIQLLLILVLFHLADDAAIVFGQFRLSKLTAESICAYAATDIASEGLHFAALDIRMKLLSICIEQDDAFDIAEGLEERLWFSLVGRGTLSEPSRNVAWNYLGVLASKLKTTHAFLDRFIDQHLTNLDPDLLTESALQFVEHGIGYKVHIISPQPDMQGVIHAPLRSFLWQAILTTQSTVALVAMHILTLYYLDSEFIVNAAPENIAATHSDFVETCFEHLQHAATLIRQFNLSLSEVNASSVIDQQAPACFMRFHRALELLGRFLAGVRLRPTFNKQQSDSPSPVSKVQYPDGVEPLSIKYQAFSEDGRDKGVKELELDPTATFSILRDELCRKTGFPDVSTIYRGKRLDLVASHSDSAKILSDGGLLIVKHVGSSQGSRVRRTSTFANSVAEDSIMKHMDALYSFLELPISLSHAVRQLLLQFPAHQKPSEIVLADNVDRTLCLFPIAHPEKTLYNLDVLRSQLSKATRAGAREDRWTFQVVEVLCNAVLQLPSGQELHRLCYEQATKQLTAFDVAWWTTNTFTTFLKERPEESFDSILRTKSAIVERLVSFLQPDLAAPLPHLCMRAYCALVEGALHSGAFWATFTDRADILDVHETILVKSAGSSAHVEDIVTLISDVCAGIVTSKSSVSAADFTAFYWPIIQANLPKALQHPNHCDHLFVLATNVFSGFADRAEETEIRQLFASWADVLLKYQHNEVPGKSEVDGFLTGMTKLLLLCLQYLKAFKKPLGQADVMDKVFTKYLFPPLADEDRTASELACSMPILMSTARKELYDLTLALCEDTSCFRQLCSSLNNLANDEQDADSIIPFGSDHQAMLRAPAGYVGLRNLTNTCYMNSLMTQLFMNADFRDFFISADFIDGSQNQKLLSATKQLLTRMQSSYSKWEDTEAFAAAIQPYDAEEIDVTIQMDVDEFYNLLFDRWESQLPDIETKSRFRSFFGGKLVTQVKSLDCQHVSERLEDYFAIQCEVKGKATLTESLRAYVLGDVMEGDNKYKCESCGGRFVNAIKRSCLKDIPDSLIFHLKRFDFDLTTMQRSKINDRFEFPRILDMNEYNVAFMDESGDEREPDLFDLTGVLVHNGTAETGHYYSYIRDEDNYSPNGAHSWLEFNDTIVEDYDPNKLATDSFGGEMSDGGAQWPWMKPNSAYMLFYRRRNPQRHGSEPLRENKGNSTSIWQQHTEDAILQDNRTLMRRACQLNPAHAHFLRALLSKLKSLNHGICSNDHTTEDLAIAVIVRYLDLFGSRSRDLDQLDLVLRHLLRHVSPCAKCCMTTLTYMVETDNILLHLLIMHPNSRVRTATKAFLCSLLSEIRSRYPDDFGISIRPTSIEDLGDWEQDGAFPRLALALSSFMSNIAKWCRYWSEYFELLGAMASMGLGELAFLLDQNMFLDLCSLLVASADGNMAIPRLHDTNRVLLLRAKKISWSSLVATTAELFQRVNQLEDPVDSTHERHIHFDWDDVRFRLTEAESQIVNVVRSGSPGPEYILLAKLLELFDPEAPDITPQLAIIRSIASLEGDSKQHSIVASTIANNIREWLPWASGPSIQMAIMYCRHIPHGRTINTLIEAVYDNARGMCDSSVRSSNPEKGGLYHLEFFKALARPHDFRCVEEAAYLQTMVLDALCNWVPHVLLCDAPAVRTAIVSWLDELLFDHLPSFTQEDEATDFDLAKTQSVRKLFDGCFMCIEVASRQGKPQARATSLMNVAMRCNAWIQCISEGAERDILAYSQLREPANDANIARLTRALPEFRWLPGDADDAGGDDAFATG